MRARPAPSSRSRIIHQLHYLPPPGPLNALWNSDFTNEALLRTRAAARARARFDSILTKDDPRDVSLGNRTIDYRVEDSLSLARTKPFVSSSSFPPYRANFKLSSLESTYADSRHRGRGGDGLVTKDFSRASFSARDRTTRSCLAHLNSSVQVASAILETQICLGGASARARYEQTRH